MAFSLAVMFVAACSGGSSGSTVGTDPVTGCSGNCADTSTFLTAADVETVIAQAVFEAQALDAQATIAVVDRVGNVLAVYRMGSAPNSVLVATRLDDAGNAVIRGGLEGIRLPTDAVPAVVIDDQAAIAKAVTGAYLSSEGNAFSTRTASQIVQENFNPGEMNQPSGPLFGVQFSQLPCSDFSQSFNGSAADAGPKRSPLGLSADPGGFPLYKGGTVVGGVGAIADGLYGADAVISDLDTNPDEMIALAATFGFGPPVDRRGDRITVDGKTFRFSDVEFGDLATDPSQAPALSTLTSFGALVPVKGYNPGVINEGTTFGTAASGIRPDGGVDFPGQDAFVFVDDANVPRYPPRDGTDGAIVGGALSTDEVRTVLSSALAVANRARAQIRRPLGSSARVTIAVVDTLGEILGMVRTRDAPVFGADVSLQKARTAALFSSASAGAFLSALPEARYLEITDTSVGFSDSIRIGDYVSALRSFLGDPGALATGEIAFSDRAGGNLARPFFPDGLSGTVHGPLSKPQGEWSPFSTGLQLDVAMNAILQHVLFVAGVVPADVGDNCAGVDLAANLSATPTVVELRIANGLQIFPGSVPIYRGETLVGGIGVSGDGVDQDDMIAFLGLHNAGLELGGAIGNAAPVRRADTLTPRGVRLRYVQCPQSPFTDSDEDNVCDGK